jgi:hypothetical protein
MGMSSSKALLLGRASDFGKPLKKHSCDAAGGEAISGHQERELPVRVRIPEAKTVTAKS